MFDSSTPVCYLLKDDNRQGNHDQHRHNSGNEDVDIRIGEDLEARGGVTCVRVCVCVCVGGGGGWVGGWVGVRT